MENCLIITSQKSEAKSMGWVPSKKSLAKLFPEKQLVAMFGQTDKNPPNKIWKKYFRSRP